MSKAVDTSTPIKHLDLADKCSTQAGGQAVYCL